MDLYTQVKAYRFYKKLLAGLRTRRKPYLEHGFPLLGAISSRDWEVFAAILTGDRRRPGTSGTDLTRHEVKSGRAGTNFSYPYHPKSCLKKFLEDKEADHIFIVYHDDEYKNIDVYKVTSKRISPIIESWERKILKTHFGRQKQERCRVAIPYDKVVDLGEKILSIKEGRINI